MDIAQLPHDPLDRGEGRPEASQEPERGLDQVGCLPAAEPPDQANSGANPASLHVDVFHVAPAPPCADPMAHADGLVVPPIAIPSLFATRRPRSTPTSEGRAAASGLRSNWHSGGNSACVVTTFLTGPPSATTTPCSSPKRPPEGPHERRQAMINAGSITWIRKRAASALWVAVRKVGRIGPPHDTKCRRLGRSPPRQLAIRRQWGHPLRVLAPFLPARHPELRDRLLQLNDVRRRLGVPNGRPQSSGRGSHEPHCRPAAPERGPAGELVMAEAPPRTPDSSPPTPSTAAPGGHTTGRNRMATPSDRPAPLDTAPATAKRSPPPPAPNR